MALIKCPECEKQISDKASSCPECGFPLKVTYEEYICCPYCGSRNLHSDKKGFSGSKALAGSVLTGGIGLLAGTIGSKNVQITCLNCASTFKAGTTKTIANRSLSDDEIEKEVRKLIDSDTPLAAVKLLKDQTNCELSEAMDKVNKMKGYVPPDKKSGCASVILLFIILSGTLFLLF